MEENIRKHPDEEALVQNILRMLKIERQGNKQPNVKMGKDLTLYLTKEGIQVVNYICKECQHHDIIEMQDKMVTM